MAATTSLLSSASSIISITLTMAVTAECFYFYKSKLMIGKNTKDCTQLLIETYLTH
jgi:hypothetical protein